VDGSVRTLTVVKISENRGALINLCDCPLLSLLRRAANRTEVPSWAGHPMTSLAQEADVTVRKALRDKKLLGQAASPHLTLAPRHV
jgi:hypothetical protein